jgi:hypothetical protein
MREIFTSGSVGGAPGNRCFYPDLYNSAVQCNRAASKKIISMESHRCSFFWLLGVCGIIWVLNRCQSVKQKLLREGGKCLILPG